MKPAIPTAVPSATVMILRDSRDGLEVLLGRRRRGKAFGEAHVFPGGVIDAADVQAEIHCQGLCEQQAADRLGIAENALSYWVAAVREVFEETGIIFASGTALTPDTLRAARRALLSGETSFARLCQEHQLCWGMGGLHYVAHWITPRQRPVRFDTRFFMARLPPAQQAEPDGVELTASVWLRPSVALARLRAGELKLASPTIVELERLSRFASVSAAMKWAAGCWREGIASIEPTVERRHGEEHISMAPEAAAAFARARGRAD